MYSRLECTAKEAAVESVEASAEAAAVASAAEAAAGAAAEAAQDPSFDLQGNLVCFCFGCDVAVDVLFRCRSTDARQRGIHAIRDMRNYDPIAEVQTSLNTKAKQNLALGNEPNMTILSLRCRSHRTPKQHGIHAQARSDLRKPPSQARGMGRPC